jgi:hypothetical protein
MKKANRHHLCPEQRLGLIGNENEARRGDRAHRADQRLARAPWQAGIGENARKVDRDRDHDEAGQRGQRSELGGEKGGPFRRERHGRPSLSRRG